VDITALLADFGFAPRTAMASELAERLRYKLLPSSPETGRLRAVHAGLAHEFDARWLRAGRGLLSACWPADPAAEGSAAPALAARLLDAITYARADPVHRLCARAAPAHERGTREESPSTR
jgi:hypothetical protein